MRQIQPLRIALGNRRWLLIIALCLLAGGLAYQRSARSAYEAQSGGAAPLDPLTSGEHAVALSVALDTLNGLTRSESEPEREVLLIERHQQAKQTVTTDSAGRQGEVFVYDYASDKLARVLVDLAAQSVLSTEEVQNVQLPLTDTEIARALDIVYADPVISQTVTEQYRAATGSELNSVADLNHRVFVFRADTMPDRVNERSALCGLHRCAQVLLYTYDLIAFEATPLVDLSTDEVVQVLWVE